VHGAVRRGLRRLDQECGAAVDRRSLELSQDNLPWVVNAYVLTFWGFLLLGGRLADLLGRRQVFMSGLVLFGVASLAGGFAESEGTLIVARAVQGLGAALLSPAALSIITRSATAPNATGRSASGARSPARAARRVSCSAAS